MIEITSLSKSYGSNKVLQNINVRFERGLVYGIVGENGSGKTTLFKCMAGMESFSGEIKSDFTDLKSALGLLSTEPYYFPKITGREYLQLLCNARQTELNHLDQKNIFNLPLDQYASTYSTGMKKKLGLMGVLLQKNEVYILDEPFNGVDIQSNILITEIIHTLKAAGKTILISSHIFSTLSENCDEIHVLKNNSISDSITKNDFGKLEQEMKQVFVGNKIEMLDIG